jgi:tryptophan 7-halogenase
VSGKQIRKVVIAGGGTAGWVTAAALSHQLRGLIDITLVESEEIGTIGVGESTVPPMRAFNRFLQIDEQEFMRSTAATFKLGILFENWRKTGEAYIHPFGITGQSTWSCEFHHFWLESIARGIQSEFGEYCLEHQGAEQQKFATSPDSKINYAYHLDAGIYARYLRNLAERYGAKRIEGKIKHVRQHAESGFIEALELESGTVVEGDLFIDCTGFRGILIEQTLQTGYEDYNKWLLCDSAVALQSEPVAPPHPYTRAIAHEAGWRWRIPLQHRVGDGFVFCSRYMSNEQATEKFLGAVEGKPITQPRVIKFRTGRRRQAWNKNVIALGLASGFIEPLESTSIHMIMTGAVRLIHLFPFAGVTPALMAEYNNLARREIEHIRDFVVLHYHANERTDSEFWRECREMVVPDSLAHRIEIFRERGHAWQADGELFRIDSWTHVMMGQGIRPHHHHLLPKAMSDADLKRFLSELRKPIHSAMERLPSHGDFLNQYCKASPDIWSVAKAAAASTHWVVNR